VSAPLVTVGVPVYSGQRYLARALDFLLAQTFDDFEIVLCDNASEDRTAEICAAYAARDPRIRFHRMFGLRRAGTLRQTQLMRNYLGSDRVMLAELSLLGSIVYVPETLHFYTVARQTTAPPLP
jgi:glycosyltransferase involved in cell wall biosynthesis